VVEVLEHEGAPDHGRAQRRCTHEVGEVEQSDAVVAGGLCGLDLRVGRKGSPARSSRSTHALVSRLTRLGVSRSTKILWTLGASDCHADR
jgi:hypothetical protein